MEFLKSANRTKVMTLTVCSYRLLLYYVNCEQNVRIVIIGEAAIKINDSTKMSFSLAITVIIDSRLEGGLRLLRGSLLTPLNYEGDNQ